MREGDEIVTAFRDGEVTLRANRRTEGFTNALAEIGYHGIRSGDLVIHSMDGFAGAIGVSDSDGKTSPVAHAYVPREAADPRFHAFVLRTYAAHSYITSLAKGIRQRSTAFDPATFGAIRLPNPPPHIQSLIADFLDRETHRVDALIDAKRRMIDLLQEKRDSERSHLVFRGSSKTANDWRELPEGWTSRPVKYVARLKSGTNITSDDIEEEVGLYPVYGGNGLRGYTNDFTHKGRHVLIGRQGALAGNINYTVDGPFFASEHAVVATPLIDAPSTWLGETLRAMNLNQYSTTAAQPGLAVEFIEGLKMPVPTPVERHRIADALDRSNHLFGSTINALTQQLALLTEYRQALITRAVTGQLEEATLKGNKPVDEAVGVIPE